MSNLFGIRRISQNREAFFERKRNAHKKINPIIWSSMIGPRVTRSQVIETIKHICGEMDFHQQVNEITTKNYSKSSSLDLVMVTCLYQRPELWRMVLTAMGSMPLKKIVAVWSEDIDGEAIEKFKEDMTSTQPEVIARIHFIKHENFPVNQKWQAGVMTAKRFSPQAILILGSDDVVTYNYLRSAMLKIREGYEFIGSRSWLATFIQDDDSWREEDPNTWYGRPDYIKLCQYNDNRLDGEFIGSGRIISTYLLNKMKWQLYTSQNPLNSSLDKHSFHNMQKYEPKMFEIPLNAQMGIGIITMRERSSEKISISFGKRYNPNIPGNTWVSVLIAKTKYVDYVISKEIYEAGLKIFYQNFNKYIEQLRKEI